MHERTPPEFVVIEVAPDGERRFAILEVSAMISEFMRSFGSTDTTEERMAFFGRLIGAQPSLTEAETRARLAERGLREADVDGHLERARRLTTLDTVGPFVFERMTRIGYVNADGQEVVRKTAREGTASQRVFVVRCRVCAHEYGAYGCDLDICRCPACQDGARGPAV